MGPKKTASAKKRTAILRQKRYRERQVNIGDQVERWAEVKECIGAPNNEAVAKCLIDSFLEYRGSKTVRQMEISQPSTSTPMQGVLRSKLPEPDTSSVSEDSDNVRTRAFLSRKSGIRRKSTLAEDPLSPKVKRIEKPLVPGKSDTETRKRTRIEFDLASSDMEDIYDPDYDPDDPTFQPDQWDISIVQSDDDESVEGDCGIDEYVHDLEDEHDEITNLDIPFLKTVTEENVMTRKFIVTEDCLIKLLDLYSGKTCHECGKPLTRTLHTIGCVVESKWSCEQKHTAFTWSSSPMLPNRVYLTNFQALTAVLVSGNNYTKIALFARFLSLGFPSHTSFSRVQGKCVVPVVSRYWENIRQSALEEHRSSQLVISGDGRMDSPGHSAKYCTYTMMNQEDKSILALEIVDKREVALKSPVLEAKGFERSIESILREGVLIKEVVTDAHPQISKIMRVSHSNIKHSYDMWHGAKNLGKKISKIACSKGNEDLKPWLKDITNHFFYSAESCNGSALEMKTKWLSVLNHVTNRHSWALGQCDHGILEEDDGKPWLKPTSKALKDLQKQVMEKRLLRTFPYYVTCQTTSELESFNNHLLMYAPKRNAFGFTVYKCRCQLAAIDYSKHVKRKTLFGSDGKPRCKRTYSKAANQWSVCPVKENKTYSYIPELIKDICMEYCLGNVTLSSPVVLTADHPKRISSTIARHSPQPTAILREKQTARLKKISSTHND